MSVFTSFDFFRRVHNTQKFSPACLPTLKVGREYRTVPPSLLTAVKLCKHAHQHNKHLENVHTAPEGKYVFYEKFVAASCTQVWIKFLHARTQIPVFGLNGGKQVLKINGGRETERKTESRSKNIGRR